MTTTPHVTTINFSDKGTFDIISTLVADESADGWFDIGAKVQIASGGQSVLLDFGAYADLDEGESVKDAVNEQLRRIDALIASLSSFRSELLATGSQWIAEVVPPVVEGATS